jgi:4-carboxymuconolactone decarboxylase
MPRIPAITTRSELDPQHQQVADAVLEVFGHIRGPFSMLLHSPTLAARLLPMVSFVRQDTIVEPGLRFVAILAAARECEAAYVWGAQVTLARKNGIREELIDVIRGNGDTSKLGADEGDVIAYIRQLMRTNRAEPATFERIKGTHGAQWIVELTAVASFFAFVSTICNAFEVAPPPDGDTLPA